MKENPDIWVHLGDWLISIREQGIGATLAGTMAFLRGRYQGGGWLKVSIDAFMCAMFAWFIRDVLNLFGLNPDLAYIGSVVIGYLGTDFIGQWLRKAAEKKAGGNNDERHS
ncbi:MULTISPECIES: phage holin, lambda family [Xenorhabdus]|uniref:Phage holin, lambda family n=1 Tax=Xenorhabdus stockiae TaxID=351614 RepID=A0A2D0KL24_9GAMM|nr:MULTISPECIES: phage holin, lambda family [Xenorhabdus]PHM52498.1 phage holin, lambda family [Xenorhabdus sp. KK7.4]PHM64102.1 phage holin, lambda family [Xenorhabdus stockiae]